MGKRTSASAAGTAQMSASKFSTKEEALFQTYLSGSSKGRPLSGVNREHFWTGKILDGSSADCDLAGALSEILDQFSPKKDLFALLTASGGRVELFVCWLFDEGNSGDVLNYKLLGRLADLKIDLSLDVYP